jgi:integrase
VTRFDLPYIDPQRGRGGRIDFYYFRRAGRRFGRLPGEPLSDEFMVEYRRLLALSEPAEPAPRQANPPGSFGALVKAYLASPEFKERKASTQAEYRRVLGRLTAKHGPKPVRLLEKRHIRQWRDDMAETPAAANTLVRTVKLLMTFAIDREYRTDNPAARLKLFKTGEWRSWTDEECLAFEGRWPSGTMERRAYILALFTGQRRGDLVAMTQADRKDGAIRVVQQKTGEALWIPEAGALTAELASVRHMSLLTTSRGKAFDAIYFGAWFADAIDAAGLPNECVLHGLRKTAARRLADADCTDAQIMAITGHRTSSMVRHYTKDADQKRLASAAIVKLENRR